MNREFNLRLINVASETSGEYLNNYGTLITMIQNDLCRQLLTNSQSHDFIILSLTLRTNTCTLRSVLKAYINTFNFNNMSLDKAIRIETCPLLSDDSTFTFAYSMIILNTLHIKIKSKLKIK